MSGSSAAGVRIVSGWGQDRYPRCQDRQRPASGTASLLVGKSEALTMSVRIVSVNVRIVSEQRQDRYPECQDCQRPASGLSPRMSGLSPRMSGLSPEGQDCHRRVRLLGDQSQ